MNRGRAVSTLREKGVPDIFLDKPGVVERIFNDYATKNPQDLLAANINILSDKCFTYERLSASGPNDKIITFKVGDDNRIRVSYGDKKIVLNSVGIDKEYYDGQTFGLSKSITREPGKVRCFSANNGTGWYDEIIGADSGSWSIENAIGPHLERNHVLQNAIPLETMLDVFDLGSEEIIDFYPNTESWYAKTRTDLINTITAHNQEKKEEAKPERRIAMLEKEIDRLTAENQQLRASNSKVTHMLSVTMDFANRVKHSRFGQLFFKKDIKNMDKTTKEIESNLNNR